MLPQRSRPPAWKGPIPCRKLLLVEGNDEACFFHALSCALGLDEEIFILDFGGVDNLANYLRLLVETPDYGFGGVASVGVVRDAEGDGQRAFQGVQRVLEQAGLPVPGTPLERTEGPPAVSVFIFPDCRHAGMLETLCVEAVRGDPAMPCVEGFFRCLEAKGLSAPGHLPKAVARVFLASRPEPYVSCGVAEYRGYWPWVSPAFDRLKRFLAGL
jgi:hypothetical protein